MSHSRRISRLIQDDSLRWEALLVVEKLRLPGGCIGAGFVRNLVWDHFHGRVSDCRHEDVDVLYYDPGRVRREQEEEFESILTAAIPELSWSVRNQARMHVRNNDLPYSSVDDAMSFWPETATAVAVAREGSTCRISAPYGLDDLMGLILRPTSLREDKVALFHERISSKDWMVRWPKLTHSECR
jgi:uncharacterized protein